MARGKGTANLAASLEVLAGAPLDARDVCPTVADLYVAANWPYKYIGMKTTVQATGDTYRLVNLDVTQESSWVLDGVPTIGIGGGYAPIGTIISYMGTTAPQDYLICDGTTYNIADYPQLSSFFNRQFGSANFFGGDGTTTFAVPDLRGEFLRGTGTNGHSGQGSGDNVGVHQDATKHQYISTDTTGSVIYAAAPITQMSNYDNRVYSGTEQKRVGTTSLSDLTNQVQNYTARPTNTSILWCIKAVVAGDVYSTDERVVGTWIDGKPIYQKTFTGLSLSTSWSGDKFASASTSALVSNVSKLISAVATDAEGSYPASIIKDGANWSIRVLGGITITGLTVQYTKTTD